TVEKTDRHRQQIAAARAAKHFVRGHEVRCLRPALILQHAAWGAFARRLLRTLRTLLPARSSLPRVVLIAALPVLAVVAHAQADYIIRRPHGPVTRRDPRTVRDPRAAGSRRHGRGLPRQRSSAAARSRDQGSTGRVRHRPRAAEAVRAG